ncbi:MULTISPECIES: 3-hydroxyacyl-ACP dehydratase FabZ family protein [Protofrankia]|uniref:3-hydroxyacyl-ACP dehydratase n=1 Tax=Protofrankia coriariae TaxID=1562887 RepID=A0ABR5F6B9_9ACTN|nr:MULTISPECIES: 3-hydroxyacyl-ACP dehydratase [Protofrankia]KLL12208.1 3-hydroxyacyl-ACP dehydratase [Protofrankia coriariae]ONH37565.1 3-hydroxyacyl-ACP dehydratase [Protofrankia sp. BMG5.30]
MIGVAEIKRIIPHRFPVLLLDGVSEVDPGRSLVAYKAVTSREPHFADLDEYAAPEAYAYPVSLLLESWAQAAVLLARWAEPNPDVLTGRVELLAGIRRVELPHPVYPGSVLRHHVELVRAVDDAAIFTGRTEVDGVTVVRVGQFTLASRTIDMLRLETKE